MPWSDLIDQHRVIDVLRRAVASDRVAHAYLFYGPQGSGKTATALEFAGALQCERAGEEACGSCLACTKVRRLIHPDVHVLFPQPKDVPVEEVRQRLQMLAANPYGPADFVRRPSLEDPSKTSNKQVQYHVLRVHEDLHRPLSFLPVEGRYTVALVTDAHLMRVEASNAFLKLLEEPGRQTVIILTTDRPERLLPTIVSRCQKLRFDALPIDGIETGLIERENVDAGRAAMIARMSGGSYARALELAAGEDLQELRDLIVEYMRLSYGRKIARLGDVVDRMVTMGRERIKSLLALMQSWIRDLVLYRALGSEAPLVNIDQQKTIADFCERLPDARLDSMVGLVEEAYVLVERNVNLALLLMALSVRLSQAMRGDDTVRLYVPLAEPLTSAA